MEEHLSTGTIFLPTLVFTRQSPLIRFSERGHWCHPRVLSSALITTDSKELCSLETGYVGFDTFTVCTVQYIIYLQTSRFGRDEFFREVIMFTSSSHCQESPGLLSLHAWEVAILVFYMYSTCNNGIILTNYISVQERLNSSRGVVSACKGFDPPTFWYICTMATAKKIHILYGQKRKQESTTTNNVN